MELQKPLLSAGSLFSIFSACSQKIPTQNEKWCTSEERHHFERHRSEMYFFCWYAWLFVRNIYTGKLIISDRWGFIFPCVFCLCCLWPHFKDRNLASIFLFNSEAEASKQWTLICNCLDESGQINANVLLFCRNLLSCPDWSHFSAAPRNLSQLPPQLH